MRCRKLPFECQVAALCDADRRTKHSATAYVAAAVSVNALAEVYAKRQRRFARIARRMVRR